MIRTKGEAGTGNIVEAVRHMRAVMKGIRDLSGMREDELYAAAKELRAPLDVVRQTAALGELPVPNFSAGGVATPADASLMRQLGAQSVFVGSGIFKAERPEQVARAIVMATTHYDNAEILVKVSTGLGEPMRGLELSDIPPEERLAVRGW
jgi:pyridoxal 5'-phosphate synthase pdxS subunit